MKILLILCATLMGFGCKSGKKIPVQESVISVPPEGYVKASITNLGGKEGCDYLLEITEEKKTFVPIQLADSLKRDIPELWIQYRLSRAPQGSCKKGNPVIIEGVFFPTGK